MSACDEFFAALLDGGPLPPEQRAHAVVCEDCRALVGEHLLRGPEHAPPPPGPALGAVFREELRTQALAEIAKTPRVVRWYVPAALLLALNLVSLFVGVRKMGFDNLYLTSTPTWRMLLTAGVLFGGLTLGLVAAVMPLGAGLRRGMTFGSVLVPVAVLASADGQRICNTVAQALPCAVVEVGYSLLPLAAAAWVLSQTAFKVERIWLAAMGGGSVGLLALHFHCLDGAPRHLLLFHLLPWAVVAGLAVVVRWRMPSRSFAP